MSWGEPVAGAKRVCLSHLGQAGRLLLESVADFRDDDLSRADAPLRPAAEILTDLAHALDAATGLVPSTAAADMTRQFNQSAGPLETVRRRLASLTRVWAEAPAEHFLTPPPPQPRLPVRALETVADAVMGLGMYLAMLAGEVQIVRHRLGKRQLDWFDI
jgi:hypothetical protein